MLCGAGRGAMWSRLRGEGRGRELQLVGTLNGGQSFRWSIDVASQVWTGIFARTVWKLKQDEDDLLYQVVGTLLETSGNEPVPVKKRKKSNSNNSKLNSKDTSFFENLLKEYFRLDVCLSEYYAEWASKDELFKSSCQQFYGIRMLAQEPVENLFSFICSQNNNISRISGMVENLCRTYGDKICEEDGNTYYAFPQVDKLADLKVEAKLRELGFGYRAKFVQQSAAQIVRSGGLDWFRLLRDMEYKEARAELMKLSGIGPKVADCVCLMSLQHLEAVPVDTHVYQIAAQHYLAHLRGKKSVTDKVYAEIGDHFRALYGPRAGWAHTVLFCADLKKFQQPTTEDTEPVKKKKR